MKNIITDPLALATFNDRFGRGDHEGAIKFARDAGYFVDPKVLNFRYLNYYLEAEKQSPEAAYVFRARFGTIINAERRAMEFATEVAGLASGTLAGPLVGRTRAEKVEAITSGQMGLSPLAAYEALKKIDETAAYVFQNANAGAIGAEARNLAAQAEAEAQQRMALAKARWDRLEPEIDRVRRNVKSCLNDETNQLRHRHSDAKGNLHHTRGYHAELAAMNAKYQQREREEIAQVTAAVDEQIARENQAQARAQAREQKK